MLWEREDHPLVPWEQEDFPVVNLNMKKQEEHEWNEVHSLWERYGQLKVKSIQPFSRPVVGREQKHGIHF